MGGNGDAHIAKLHHDEIGRLVMRCDLYVDDRNLDCSEAVYVVPIDQGTMRSLGADRAGVYINWSDIDKVLPIYDSADALTIPKGVELILGGPGDSVCVYRNEVGRSVMRCEEGEDNPDSVYVVPTDKGTLSHSGLKYAGLYINWSDIASLHLNKQDTEIENDPE